MLVSLHWFIFLLNLPVATWNIYRFIMVPSGNMGVFDPTEIHNRGQLKSHMKEAMIKLGFHLLCFFMYLYSMILALINDWSPRSCARVRLQHAAREPQAAELLLRTAAIAVYFFLFEQKKNIFAVFLPYKVFKNTNWVFVDFWFSTLAQTLTHFSSSVCWRLSSVRSGGSTTPASRARETKDTRQRESPPDALLRRQSAEQCC